MSSMDQLPRERELPAERHEQLRSRLLTMIAKPDRRRRSRIVLAAGLAAAAVAAVMVTTVGRPDTPEIYALGDNALSEGVRDAGRQCLRGVRDANDHDPFGEPWPTWPADSPPTLLNHVERPDRGALVIYQTRSELIYCTIGRSLQNGEYLTTGPVALTGMSFLETSSWLPGSVSIELAGSSDLEGGYTEAAGRVSERVARVVLDDGAGHPSTARLARGTFVVYSDGPLKTRSGVLTSYDANGTELDRFPMLFPQAGRCYLDPAGKPVNPTTNHVLDESYRSNPRQCTAAEPWTARNSGPGRSPS